MTGRIEPGGRPFPMDDFGQHQADAYLAARRSGKVQPDDHRAAGSPRDGTLRNEFLALSAVCNWAVVFKVNGRRLLAHNPVRDVTMPQEKNIRRPVASRERFEKLLVLCSQSLFRFADVGDDGLCRGGPDKGCGVIVSAIDVVVDRLD